MTGPRPYPPIPDADWPKTLADMAGGFATTLNVYRTMAHHPDLLRAWAPLREHVVNQNALGPEGAEVVILRTGLRLGSAYEWDQHVVRARARGVSDARIFALRGPLEDLDGTDELLARAVDELFEHARLTPPTRQGLADAFGAAGVFDLMATVGFYSTLGFLLNTCGTPLDDDIDRELAARPLAGAPPQGPEETGHEP